MSLLRINAAQKIDRARNDGVASQLKGARPDQDPRAVKAIGDAKAPASRNSSAARAVNFSLAFATTPGSSVSARSYLLAKSHTTTLVSKARAPPSNSTSPERKPEICTGESFPLNNDRGMPARLRPA